MYIDNEYESETSHNNDFELFDKKDKNIPKTFFLNNESDEDCVQFDMDKIDKHNKSDSDDEVIDYHKKILNICKKNENVHITIDIIKKILNNLHKKRLDNSSDIYDIMQCIVNINDNFLEELKNWLKKEIINDINIQQIKLSNNNSLTIETLLNKLKEDNNNIYQEVLVDIENNKKVKREYIIIKMN